MSGFVAPAFTATPTFEIISNVLPLPVTSPAVASSSTASVLVTTRSAAPCLTSAVIAGPPLKLIFTLFPVALSNIGTSVPKTSGSGPPLATTMISAAFAATPAATAFKQAAIVTATILEYAFMTTSLHNGFARKGETAPLRGRRRRGRFCNMQVLGDYGSAVISQLFDGFITSVGSEAVDPASASGVDEGLLGAPLAHMRRIPRRVLAARPVAVAKHGPRAIRRDVRVLLRQRHAVRGPVVAGVIGAVGERTAQGVRTGQDVVLVAAGRRPHPWNVVTLDGERGRTLDVVAVALLVAMQVGDVAGDQLAPDIVPGAAADAIARIDTRLVGTLFLAEICLPGARGGLPAQRLGLVLADLVGAREPAKITGAGRVVGNEEARELGIYRRRLLLGLRQHGCRPEKTNGNGRKNDHSRHVISSLMKGSTLTFIAYHPQCAAARSLAHAALSMLSCRHKGSNDRLRSFARISSRRRIGRLISMNGHRSRAFSLMMSAAI